MFKRTLTLMSLSLILFASCGSEVASVTTPAVTNGANTGAPPAGNPPAGMPANGQRGPGALPPNAEELRVEYPEFIAALEGIQNLEPQARAEALDQLYVEHPEWKDILPAPPAGGQRVLLQVVSPLPGEPMAHRLRVQVLLCRHPRQHKYNSKKGTQLHDSCSYD